MEYLWTQGVKMPSFPALEGDASVDVLIIGGGMAGLMCALKLREAGVEYLLLEGGRIGMGITKGTTAVLSAQHDTLYQDMISMYGRETAAGYLEANLKAVERYRKLAEKYDCDFEDRPSVIYSLTDGERMEREAEAVMSLGFEAKFLNKTSMPYPVAGAVEFPSMAQFHPLKFMAEAARGLNIRENTFVECIEGRRAVTNRGVVRAKSIIVATHFPFKNSRGLYFAKLYQKRSYVIAYENAPDIGCTIEDIEEGGFYLRNYGKLLLIGGGDHRTGRRGGSFEAVSRFAERYFPKAKEKYRWANQDCISLDTIPYIGRYSQKTPGLLVASGFNEWGMTTSAVAAEILCDMAVGKPNGYAEVFRPNRSMLHPQLFFNLASTTFDMMTPTLKRCSHMGCALKWNPAEHSWDCPCHGSRFNEEGGVIDNPATRPTRVD